MGRVKKWTREELYEMKRLYPTFFNKVLAELFGRSPKAIVTCAARLNLKKSAVFMEECKHLPGRFQKGHIPHNKGVTGLKRVPRKTKSVGAKMQEQRKYLDCIPNPFERMKGCDDWEYVRIKREYTKQ